MAPCDEGKYLLVEEAQAKIDALHAECDRLTASLQEAHDCYARSSFMASFPKSRALFAYRIHLDEETNKSPLERFRLFCRVAMRWKDFEDSEPFFNDVSALLEKPKVLEAHEVTEQGYYWRFDKQFNEWAIVYITDDGGNDLIMRTAGADWFENLEGRFVGPLPVPEV